MRTSSLSNMDLCQFIGVCLGCGHWQVDISPRGRSEHGGQNAAMHAVCDAHFEHTADCPGGTEGRVLFNGQWVERPKMSDGADPTGVVAFQPLPRWWVWR